MADGGPTLRWGSDTDMGSEGCHGNKESPVRNEYLETSSSSELHQAQGDQFK
jgi:hypothetical protein